MAIDSNVHKAVVIITTAKNGDAVALGFDSLISAMALIANQVTEEVEQLPAIEEAITQDGYTIEGVNYRVMDIETWEDNYGAYDEDKNDD